jgi:general secretion pathway protein D
MRRVVVTRLLWGWALALGAIASAPEVRAQDSSSVRAGAAGITIHMVDVDLRAAIQALSPYLPKPVLTGGLPAVRVSLQTPGPIAREAVGGLLRALIESHGLTYADDSAYVRIGPAAEAPTQGTPATQAARDRPPQEEIQLFVVHLRHARAADVAATVNLLFGGGGEFSGRAGLSTGTLSDELRGQNVAPYGRGRTPADSAPTAGAKGQTGSLRGAVTIVPDELTNALLVRASPSDFRTLSEAVNELDIRPLQVLIEVLIVEARHDRNFSLGADLVLPPQGTGDNGTVAGTLVGGGIGDLVIRLMKIGHIDLEAVLRTSQSKGDVEIISRPVLLASNNTEARFLVGSQRPFVQVSRSLPTDSPSRDQVIQYRDVGTKLTVRPTINQDGYVSLAIQQEINAATNETQFDAPIISTREVATQVLVGDGQTIVLGGLRDSQRDRSQRGIPVLSGIPIVGGLFGSSDRRSTATELYVFLTPRILRTDADADSVTAPRLPRVAPQ